MRTALVVPEDKDVPLAERVKRVNNSVTIYGDALLVSIHANAGGGTGWECFTSPGQTKADKYADIFCEEAKREFPLERMRNDYLDGDPDKEDAFYVLTQTRCPAVLTENFFMDTEKDCRLIMSEEGRRKIADFHVRAILRCVALQK